MTTSRRSSGRRSLTIIERDQQVHRGPPSKALARSPDPSAQGGNRIRTPVQTDAVIGFLRLGGKALLEYAVQIVGRDPNAVVAAVQMQLFAIVLMHDLRCHLQHTLVL